MKTMTTEESLPVRARAAVLVQARGVWAQMKNLGEQVVSRKVRLVNFGREFGLLMQELCAHEHMHFSFYENVKAELPDGVSFSAVQKCIHLAHALPAPAATFEEAQRAEQTVLLALGIADEPERKELQEAHEGTPVTVVFKTLAVARDRLTKLLARGPKMDAEMRASVREQIARHKDWVAEFEAQI